MLAVNSVCWKAGVAALREHANQIFSLLLFGLWCSGGETVWVDDD